MKRSQTPSSSAGASEKKKKFSQSEVESLIEVEVLNAVTQNSIKLQGLVDVIQRLDHEVDFEHTIQRLEARVQSVTKRAEAALANMSKNKESFLPAVEAISTDSEDEPSEAAPQTGIKNNSKGRKLYKIMSPWRRRLPPSSIIINSSLHTDESTKKALNRMRADKESLRAAIVGLNEDLSPPAHSPRGPTESKETLGFPQLINSEEGQKNESKVATSEEPKAEWLKVESYLRNTNAEEGTSPHPLLPATSFPASVSPEAAAYNRPPKLTVQLALIRRPASLSALWMAEGQEFSAPPMENYSILMTMEQVKGSGVFPDWRTVGKVKARTLPMCVLINKYKPGHKVCVAVVGKDKFGRYGPYSEVVTAVIPE